MKRKKRLHRKKKSSLVHFRGETITRSELAMRMFHAKRSAAHRRLKRRAVIKDEGSYMARRKHHSKKSGSGKGMFGIRIPSFAKKLALGAGLALVSGIVFDMLAPAQFKQYKPIAQYGSAVLGAGGLGLAGAFITSGGLTTIGNILPSVSATTTSDPNMVG